MKKFLAIALVSLAPSVAFAQAVNASNSSVFNLIQNLINAILPIIFALAILFFLFQLAMFLLNTGEKKEDAKTGMLWGIIILVVMFSIGGIISLVQGTFFSGGSASGQIEAPTFDTGAAGINF